ncbi:hypothetical protein INR49_004038, partial [Caranx melampygus]
MAAARAAAGSSTSTDFIDIYGDLNQNDEDLSRIAEANELFDAVLTGSVDREKKVTTKVAPPKETVAKGEANSPAGKTQKGGNPLRKLSLYIGNFPWWTSDKDLTNMVHRLGVKDVKEIKFAENRVNGQSRGQTSPSTSGDFEDLMNRNRAVASSAISKAVSGAAAGDLRVAMETLLTAIAIIKQSRVYGDERCQTLVTSLKDCLVSIQGNCGYSLDHTNIHFLTGVAVALGTKRGTATGVVTGRESAIENGTRKIPLTGKVQECLEDTEIVPGAEIGTRSAHGNGKENETGTEKERGNEKQIGTEIGNGTDIEITETETDTADLQHSQQDGSRSNNGTTDEKGFQVFQRVCAGGCSLVTCRRSFGFCCSILGRRMLRLGGCRCWVSLAWGCRLLLLCFGGCLGRWSYGLGLGFHGLGGRGVVWSGGVFI